MATHNWCQNCTKIFDDGGDYFAILENLNSFEVRRWAQASPQPNFYVSNVAHQITALLDAAASCELCRFLLRAKDAVLRHLKAKGCEWAPFTIDISWVIVTRGQVAFGMKPIGDGWVVDSFLWVMYTVYCAPSLPCPWGVFPVMEWTPGPASPAALSKMSAWIRRCTTEHTACGSVGLSSPLPTRVVDVSDPTNVKLIESSGMTGRYLCLSHCWGEHQPLRTLTSNYADHLSSIPWSKIPETFQDAITLTRKLGFSYIWIDSLCIVQDDAADWEAEARKMMDIYQNCFLTIAGTSSPSSNTGLFLETQIPAEISGTTEQGDAYTYHLRPSVQHFSHSNMPGVFLQRWPLLTRAWVLQERLLAPRVIHVARPELFWECRACIDCECTSPTNPPPLNIGPLTNLKPNYWATANDPTKTFTTQHWWALVELYTSLKLSFRSDTFPALSGLVKHIIASSSAPEHEASSPALYTPASYLAGLWRPTLPVDLLWKNNNEYIRHSPIPGPQPYLAPSWSWASSHRRFDTNVVFPGGGLRRDPRDPNTGVEKCTVATSFVHIVDARCSTFGGDGDVGRVKPGAHLKVEGFLFKGRIKAEVGQRGVEWKVGERLRVECSAEFYVGRDVGAGKAGVPGGSSFGIGGRRGVKMVEKLLHGGKTLWKAASGNKTNARSDGFKDEGGEFLVYDPTCLRGAVTLDGHPAECMALAGFEDVCKCSPPEDDCKNCQFQGAELRQKDVVFMPMAVVDLVEEFSEPGGVTRERFSLVLEEVGSEEPGPPRYRRIGMMAEQIGEEDSMFVLEDLGRKIDAGDMSAKIDDEDREGLGAMEGRWEDTVYRGAVVLV